MTAPDWLRGMLSRCLAAYCYPNEPNVAAETWGELCRTGYMNLSPRWVGMLSEAGIEAAHWSKLGAHNASDSEIMAFAAANNYIVLTHDLDFSAILAATRGEKPSVVQIRAEDVSPDVISKQVIVALRQMATELEDGALLTIEPNRTRLRVLLGLKSYLSPSYRLIYVSMRYTIIRKTRLTLFPSFYVNLGSVLILIGGQHRRS
jgi:predicted nuclease of predicted toxin-antitoxin system